MEQATLQQLAKECCIPFESVEDAYAATPFQAGLFTNPSIYVQRVVHSLGETVDLTRLMSALEQTVSLHSTLRTRITDSDQGLMQVVESANEQAASYVRFLPETQINQYLDQDRARPMGLNDRLARFAIVGRKLVTTIHHAISDHYSIKFMFESIWDIYKQRIPETHASYRLFSEYCSSINEEDAIEYWQKRLGGTIPAVFPIKHFEGPAAATLQSMHFINLNAMPSSALMPLYVEAAWGLAASDYTGSADVAFGQVVSGRTPSLGPLRSTLGPTIVTVPVTIRIGRDMTVESYLKSRSQARRQLHGSPALQYGLARIRHKIGEEARAATQFQTVLNILHESDTAADTREFSLDAEIDIRREYGLVLTCTILDSGVRVKAGFDDNIFESKQVNRVLKQFEHRLRTLIESKPQAALKSLQRLNFGDTGEIMSWNKHSIEPESRYLHQIILERANQFPHEPAVDAWDGTATYQELEVMANNMAFRLAKAEHILPGQAVAFCMDRSLAMIVTVLGILKAGATCVPVDQSLPVARKEAILDSSDVHLVLVTSSSDCPTGRAHCIVTLDRNENPKVPLGTNVDVNRPAYVLFTSGSTGKPKGVILSHQALANTFDSFGTLVGWQRGSRSLQFASPAWDACALEMLGPLLKGACVCVPSPEARSSALGEYIRAARVDFAIQTPTALRNLDPAEVAPVLKTLMSAGEKMPPELAQRWVGTVRLLNGWGLCETSVCSSVMEIKSDSPNINSIGKPMGCSLWIVHPEQGNLLPIGAVGEILVYGPGVALGYINEPEKTAACFITPPPFVPSLGGPAHRKAYLTGDLAQYNADGNLVLMGRKDNQVKIRGQRFELDDVEQVLKSHREVDNVVVHIQTSGRADQTELVAVLALRSAAEHALHASHSKDANLERTCVNHDRLLELQSIKQHATERLAGYMVPTVWIPVTSLPLMASTKVDRTKIKNWVSTVDLDEARKTLLDDAGTPEGTFSEPETEREKAIQLVWSGVLAIGEKSIDRNSFFIGLGGDSITAMQVSTRLRKQRVRIAATEFLQRKTLAQIAAESEASAPTSKQQANGHQTNHHGCALTPMQRLLLGRDDTQTVNGLGRTVMFEVSSKADNHLVSQHVRHALDRLVCHHVSLRSRFLPRRNTSSLWEWEQRIADDSQTPGLCWRFTEHNIARNNVDLNEISRTTQNNLDIKEGPVFAADLLLSDHKPLLALTAHDLVADVRSWSILQADLDKLLHDTAAYLPPYDITKHILQYHELAGSLPDGHRQSWPSFDSAYWGLDQATIPSRSSPIRFGFELDAETTKGILGEACNIPLSTSSSQLIIAALLHAFSNAFPDRGNPALYVQDQVVEHDAERRGVGCLDTIFPVCPPRPDPSTELLDTIVAVKDEFNERAANARVNFWSKIFGDEQSFERSQVEMLFRFDGKPEHSASADRVLLPYKSPIGKNAAEAQTRHLGTMELVAFVNSSDCLALFLTTRTEIARQDELQRWILQTKQCLHDMFALLPERAPKLTRSDVRLLHANKDMLSNIGTHLERLGISEDNVESVFPCTALQDGMLLSQWKKDWTGQDYRNRGSFKLSSTDGIVDVAKVVETWKLLCKTQPILRTVFTTELSLEGIFQQVVLKQTHPKITVQALQSPECFDPMSLLTKQERPRFGPADPPHSLTVYTDAAGKIAMFAVLDICHSLVDGRTMRTIWEKMAQGYRDPAQLTKGKDLSGYVAWLRGRADTANRYWMRHLNGAQPCLLRDYLQQTKGEEQYVTRGPVVPFHDSKRVNVFCQKHGITVATFVQTAWAMVLHRVTKLSTVYIGCVRSDQDALDESVDILGPLVTMFVCKFRFHDTVTPLSLLATAGEDGTQAMKHSGTSLSQLHDDLGLGHQRLFDTVMTIQQAWPQDLGKSRGLVVEVLDGEDPTEFSVSVKVQYSKAVFNVQLSHEQSVVSRSQAKKLADLFASAISQMLDRPEDVATTNTKPREMTTDDLRDSDLGLLRTWNTTLPAAFEDTVPKIFKQVAREKPSALALTSWDGTLDYETLDRCTDRLAHQLCTRYKVARGQIIPMACEKSAAAIVLMLAILKAGAAYLPLDISTSTERLKLNLELVRPSLVLVNTVALQDKMLGCIPSSACQVSLFNLEVFGEDQDNSPSAGQVSLPTELLSLRPQDPAYVTFTSGSTGKPKCILTQHRNVVTSAMRHAQRIGLDSESRVLQLANFCFDMSVGEILWSIMNGACLCVPSEDEKLNDLAGAINRMQVNFLIATPTHVTALSPDEVPSLKTLLFGGEPLRQDSVEIWATRARLINGYGPAETTIMVSCCDVAVGSHIQDIGGPSACRFWVVDPDNHDSLVPIGTTGELVIEGPVVVPGYLHNDEATSKVFIQQPAWAGKRELADLGLDLSVFYKTGDLVIQQSQHSFLYQGRKDTQAKIRGQRVELGEIEFALKRHSESPWQWIVDTVDIGGNGDCCLVAFFCTDKAGTSQGNWKDLRLLTAMPSELSQLYDLIKQSLPSYMLPEYFLPVSAIPTSPSMKADRKALRCLIASFSRHQLLAYRAERDENQDVRTRKRGEVAEHEIPMRNAWAAVLGVPEDSIKANDNFLQMGGNSMKAVRLNALLRRSGCHVSVADIYKAVALSDLVAGVESKALVKGRPPMLGPLPWECVPELGALSDEITWMHKDNVQSLAPTTDMQAWMLEVSERAGRSFYNEMTITTPSEDSGLDLKRIEEACRRLLAENEILRTVFVRTEKGTMQVVLKSVPGKQIHVWGDSGKHDEPLQHDLLKTLPNFHLFTRQGRCHRLEIGIHHALYDAFSMGLLLRDLSAIYAGQNAVVKPTSFHTWVMHSDTKSVAEAESFWRRMLSGSELLAWPQRPGEVSADGCVNNSIHSSVPIEGLQLGSVTLASIFNAVWSIVLSLVMNREDLVFGSLSANRYSNTVQGVELVPGPCITVAPIRAVLGDGKKTLKTLAQELLDQTTESLPHQILGFRTMIKNCTDWGTSRFNSIIVFQNHGGVSQEVKFGNVDCVVTGEGRVGNSADVWLSASPQSHGQLEVELIYDTERISESQGRWLTSAIETIQGDLKAQWVSPLEHIQRHVVEVLGDYPHR